jgi:hypothetical protein
MRTLIVVTRMTIAAAILPSSAEPGDPDRPVPVCPEPEFEGNVSGRFYVHFKRDLRNLGAEVYEKSAVKLRDF